MDRIFEPEMTIYRFPDPCCCHHGDYCCHDKCCHDDCCVPSCRGKSHCGRYCREVCRCGECCCEPIPEPVRFPVSALLTAQANGFATMNPFVM